MSIGLAIFLTDANLLRDDYFAFLNSCASILGKWCLTEVSPMDPNADEILHECFLTDGATERGEKDVGVSIALGRRNFAKRFGRSRKKIFWDIYVETMAGRSFWSYAIQLYIPLEAFRSFPGCVVVTDSDKTFLDPKNYEAYVARELEGSYGKGYRNALGLNEAGPGAEQTPGADSPVSSL